MKSSNLVKSIFSYTTAMVISQALVAIYTIILIWWLNSEQYGIISANSAGVLFSSFIISLGLHEWLIRSIPLEKKPKALTGGILVYKFLIGIIWGSSLIVFLPKIKPDIYHQQLLIFIILDVWLESCFYLFLADLLGNKRVMITSSLLISSRVLRLISLLVIIFLGYQSPTLIVASKMASTIILCIIAFILSRPDFSQIKEFSIFVILKKSIVYNASEILNLIFLQIDLNLLVLFNGNPSLVGDFAITLSVINMVMTIPLGIASMMLPSTIETYQESQKRFIRHTGLIGVVLLLVGILSWSIISLFSVESISQMLGENFRSALIILVSLSPVLLIRTINQLNRIYLISTKQEGKQLIPQTLAILSKLLLGYFALKLYALEGLIWTSIICDLSLLLGFSIPVIRHFSKLKSKII